MSRPTGSISLVTTENVPAATAATADQFFAVDPPVHESVFNMYSA
ncbi:hypothetical protein SCATT_00090 [Streptantibioticus cattleyicolor NRRL 8057 = DSM 46488]|uniref:Uncharacterized protein n=1 Tax=Streptantibioticus cattleyicolor (strain ATCC 35852 / DSM 46488 / JCM 4925 / NBRC 14057 / NRRL 8057) TaxID=1003195 RepID=G8WVT5_STREN|nr:hypothetical protein SCATT_00090 [Streptantibioticus cattleyicolor NRRL 8057 = DSM 46488]